MIIKGGVWDTKQECNKIKIHEENMDSRKDSMSQQPKMDRDEGSVNVGGRRGGCRLVGECPHPCSLCWPPSWCAMIPGGTYGGNVVEHVQPFPHSSRWCVTPGPHALPLPTEFSVGFLSEDRSGQQAISMPCDPDVQKQVSHPPQFQWWTGWSVQLSWGRRGTAGCGPGVGPNGVVHVQLPDGTWGALCLTSSSTKLVTVMGMGDPMVVL